MEFSPGPLARLFFRTDAWQVCATEAVLEWRMGHRNTHLALDAIVRVQCITGLVWAIVEIGAGRDTVTLNGLSNTRARQLAGLLRQRVADALLCLLEPHRTDLGKLWESYTAFLEVPHYLAHADLQQWRQINTPPSLGSSVPFINRVVQFFQAHSMSSDTVERASILMAALRGDSTILEKRNEDFVTRELAACQRLFDAVENTPLTPEQRRASVVMEDRNLLVASAGSGKTSTVVGKVGYALSRQLVAPEEILIVAFNAHAAREIEARVRERLGPWIPGPVQIAARTFHALGLEIISAVEGVRPTVAGGADEDRVTGELIADLLTRDGEFSCAWVRFNALYPLDAADPASFETASAWRAYVEHAGEHSKGRHGFHTLDGWLAGSQGECAIANWLHMNGVEYLHPHWPEPAPMPGGPRRRGPGFCLRASGLYLLHHALDIDGKAPAAHRKAFRACRRWQRRLSENEGRQIIETSYSEYVSGTLFAKLESEFIARGIPLHPRSTRRLVAKLREVYPRRQEEISTLLHTFMKHARASQMTPETLQEVAHTQSNLARAQLFVRLAITAMSRYAAALKEKRTVDFGEMILRATRYADAGRYQLYASFSSTSSRTYHRTGPLCCWHC